MSRSNEARLFEAIAAHGFVRRNGSWKRGALTYRRDGDWSLLESRARGRDVDGRGLWRVARDSGRHVFEIPGGMTDKSELALMLAFGIAGHEGELASGVQAEDLPSPRTVRRGSATSQGRWLVDHRLKLSYPLAVWPRDASSERIAWLERTLAEARRWRFVRIRREAERVSAEVELTGVPEPLLGPLADLAHDALVAAVGWVLPSISVLVEHEVRAIAALQREQACGRSRSATSPQEVQA